MTTVEHEGHAHQQLEHVQHLTIVGDRQAGKTHLLINIAIDEAARQNRSVLFFVSSRDYARYILQNLSDRSEQLVPGLTERVYWTGGKERIHYVHGGVVRFNVPRDWDRFDTVIVDDVAGGDVDFGATRIYRASMR